jgi:hypothetical protein
MFGFNSIYYDYDFILKEAKKLRACCAFAQNSPIYQ